MSDNTNPCRFCGTPPEAGTYLDIPVDYVMYRVRCINPDCPRRPAYETVEISEKTAFQLNERWNEDYGQRPTWRISLEAMHG